MPSRWGRLPSSFDAREADSVCEHLTQTMECPERLHSLSVSRERPHAVLTTLLAF